MVLIKDFNKRFRIITKLFLSFFALLIFAKSLYSNELVVVDDSVRLVKDSPITAMLDSMISLKYFQVSKKSLSNKIVNRHGFEPDSVPLYSDSVYRARVAVINARSPISLDYNESVRGYINLYAIRKREQVMRMLGLAEYYFPLFEEKLDKYNMPLELKYLAIVESALNAGAKSRAGAMGLWQFMYGTGKMHQLKIDSYIDERCDPYKSTEAACQYMGFLYKLFGDWQLVLAAYNAGPGTVNKAIRRSGGKRNYWELRSFLPAETRGYVPAFIAVNYIMNYPEEHNFHPIRPVFVRHEIDTIRITEEVSFEQISGVLGIPISHLEFLNPTYKKNFIPKAVQDQKNILCLPRTLVALYMNNDSSIYAYNKPIAENEVKANQELSERENKAKVKKIHVVRSGEHLNLIAKKYHCEVAELKEWNNLRASKLNKGQKLIVYIEGKNETKPSATEKNVQASSKTPILNESNKEVKGVENKVLNKDASNAKFVYYTIQPGDTLWDIAKKYQGVTIEDIKRLNNIKNAKSLKPGTKLKVGVAS